MSSSTTLTSNQDNEERADYDSISSAANATTNAKERATFPGFLIKAVEKSKTHHRSCKGEKVLENLLKMAKVAGYDNTFKHGMKAKWINQVFETAFEPDGNLNG